MSKKNKKCCVCGSPTYGKGLSNDLGTCICLSCARAIRDIMMMQAGKNEAGDYCQPIIPDSSLYIPPFPVNPHR